MLNVEDVWSKYEKMYGSDISMSHKQLRIYATNDDQCGNGMHALLNWYQGNGH